MPADERHGFQAKGARKRNYKWQTPLPPDPSIGSSANIGGDGLTTQLNISGDGSAFSFDLNSVDTDPNAFPIPGITGFEDFFS